MPSDLYVHFPFCRRKCSYCALHSQAGTSAGRRAEYVRRLVVALADARTRLGGDVRFRTVYFGGGSPALCDLRPLFDAFAPLRADDCEFTVELHPLDVSPGLLETLRAGGVTRISMGVQSLDDAVLEDMGRGYAIDEAERAFRLVRERFDNAGIDLIVGYPGESADGNWERLRNWGLRHCSVYSLILEERSILGHRVRRDASAVRLPSDDETLDRLATVARLLSDMGLRRYEISNYALPGYECRHNLAVWRGADYLGLGDGAFGRIGLTRTSFEDGRTQTTTVDPATDLKERTLFRLRTREGLDATHFPEWRQPLEKYVREGLLTRTEDVYFLTDRGTEVCDSILADIV